VSNYHHHHPYSIARFSLGEFIRRDRWKKHIIDRAVSRSRGDICSKRPAGNNKFQI